jgi:hypothetical protein
MFRFLVFGTVAVFPNVMGGTLIEGAGVLSRRVALLNRGIWRNVLSQIRFSAAGQTCATSTLKSVPSSGKSVQDKSIL